MCFSHVYAISTDILENPFWASLATAHRHLAIEHDGVLRVPADIAPFMAIERDRPIGRETLERLLDGPTYLLGPRPSVPAGYRVEDLGLITQMVCDERQPVDDRDIYRLTDEDAIRGLAALVYPHYFRHRTARLGRYHGIGKLEAMIGERMALPGYREVSAVCTHPAHTGKGLARRLLAFAGAKIFDDGEVPFLQVSPTNLRAIELYLRNGYRRTRELPFFRIVPSAPART